MRRLFYLLFAIGIGFHSAAQLRVSSVFGDHMVLQRDQPLKIWGYARPKELVQIQFDQQKARVKADKSGKWVVELKSMPFGGPYDMKISGSREEIILEDLLIGDVWIGSGQSNMEWPLFNTISGDESIATSKNSQIRLFTVDKDMADSPNEEVKTTGWSVAGPESVAYFSAVAYHFGKQINKDVNIPIGLIHSSWGGTDIEAWMSWESLTSLSAFSDLDKQDYIDQKSSSEKNMKVYQAALDEAPGMKAKWFDPETTDYSKWDDIMMPQGWENTIIGQTDGIVWFAKSFELSEDHLADATLSLGPIDDVDETYVNGQLVGSLSDWSVDRTYEVKQSVLKVGTNWLVIRITDIQGGGGIYGDSEKLFLDWVGKPSISLAGMWKYQPAILSKNYGNPGFGPNQFPSCLYNAMIAPISDLSIKGVIWYQGENNTRNPKQYQQLFPEMISDWRKQFGQEFPFIWVQLANFMAPADQPKESNWAELREAQSMTLSLPKTGQAVIIDIGEANDIHPRNKKDVGYRLALAAEKIAYEKELVYSGPTYQSIEINGSQAVLTFSNVGEGLITKDKYGYVKGFAIAGADGQFVWAKAAIKDDKVLVWSEAVSSPKFVRYAWGDNPDDASLYNQEGLPASPFRTDKP